MRFFVGSRSSVFQVVLPSKWGEARKGCAMRGTKLEDRVGKTLAEATEHQLKGDTGTALRMLEDLERLARPVRHKSLPMILIQKAGWLRELGRTEQAKAALDEADTLSDDLPPLMLPNLRMEQA